MALDAQTRKVVKNIIDQAISMIPAETKIIQQSHLKSELKLKEENDFILGMVWSYIIFNATNYYVNRFGKSATNEELSDLVNIVQKRIKEMKDAVRRAA